MANIKSEDPKVLITLTLENVAKMRNVVLNPDSSAEDKENALCYLKAICKTMADLIPSLLSYIDLLEARQSTSVDEMRQLVYKFEEESCDLVLFLKQHC